MGRPYSDDIRVRVGGAVGAGQSRRGAANRFGVSASSAIRWVSRMASEGTASARMQGRPRGKGQLSDHLAYLTAAVEAEPDLQMPELATSLLADRGGTAHEASIHRAL